MPEIQTPFGFYPIPLKIDAGPVSICTLPNLDEVVEDINVSGLVHKDWIFAPPQRTRDFISGENSSRPYSARVFGLPKTHKLHHTNATDEAHLDFHMWVLSFFLGMRLTTTDAGFLDATPIKPGKLVDFTLVGPSLERAIELTDLFWMKNLSEPRNPQRFAAAVHALFLAEYPGALQFERFLFLYTAIDACYRLTSVLQPSTHSHNHAERIGWMCTRLGIDTPSWATTSGSRSTEVSALRNDAVHEALYLDEPLGFAVHGASAHKDITLEMNALVCRLLVALIGGNTPYLGTPVDRRQRQGLCLS